MDASASPIATPDMGSSDLALLGQTDERVSPRPEPFRVLRLVPHEIVFGLFLVLTWARLVTQGGLLNPPSLSMAGLILVNVAVVLWADRRPTEWRWRVRLLLYPLMMGLSFYLLPAALDVLDRPSADAQLVAWDDEMFGADLAQRVQAWEHPFVTEVMMLAYLFFFYYLIAGPAHYCLRDLRRFRQCFAGLFTIYGLGLTGYTLIPAGGPHRFLSFAAPLEGGWITAFAKPWVDGASNGMDAFPSIHVAVSLYLLVFDGWHNRRRFWWLLAPCVALWVSTVYLRYHYGVDLFAGVVVSAIGLGVASLYDRSRSKISDLLPSVGASAPSLSSR